MSILTGIKKNGQLFLNIENVPSKTGIKINHVLTSFFKSSIEVQVQLSDKIKSVYLDESSFKAWGVAQGLSLSANLSKKQSSFLIQKYVFDKNKINFAYPEAVIGKGSAKLVHWPAAEFKLSNFLERIFCKTVTLFVATDNGLEKMKIKKQKLVSWLQLQNIKASSQEKGIELAQKVYAKNIEFSTKGPNRDEEAEKLKAQNKQKEAEELAKKLKVEEEQKAAEDLVKLKKVEAEKVKLEAEQKAQADQKAKEEATEQERKLKVESDKKAAEELAKLKKVEAEKVKLLEAQQKAQADQRAKEEAAEQERKLKAEEAQKAAEELAKKLQAEEQAKKLAAEEAQKKNAVGDFSELEKCCYELCKIKSQTTKKAITRFFEPCKNFEKNLSFFNDRSMEYSFHQHKLIVGRALDSIRKIEDVHQDLLLFAVGKFLEEMGFLDDEGFLKKLADSLFSMIAIEDEESKNKLVEAYKDKTHNYKLLLALNFNDCTKYVDYKKFAPVTKFMKKLEEALVS